MSSGSTDGAVAIFFRDLLKRLCHGRLGKARGRHDTSDIAQEAVLSYLQRGEPVQVRTRRELEAYGRRMAIGQAAKMRRYNDAECRAVSREEAGVVDKVQSPADDADYELERSELLTAVAEAMQNLTPEQQSVVYLYVVESHSMAEVARKIGQSAKVCSRIIRDAIASVREHLRNSGLDLE